MQRYSSANTSVNSSRLPKLYSAVADEIKGKSVIDYGCGKFLDTYRDKVDADLSGFDPYNRPDKGALSRHYDIALCSNVLNVIAEEENRRQVLAELDSLADEVYVSVYEGDRSGVGKPSKADCYQLNRRSSDYLPEIREVFPDARLRNGIIVCKFGTSQKRGG